MKHFWYVGVALCGFVCSLQAQDSLKVGDLHEIVVTGTGTQHLLANAPVQTEVISSRMIRQFGGRSLEEILSSLSASFAFNEGDMGSQMQMNGLGNNYILVLIDGKRIHGDVGGENDLSLIDPHNIEKIEIVKGASSALYGSDAIAGVINIITKKHDEGLMVENSTRYGSYNDLRQHNGLAFKLVPVKSYTNFQRQHTDGWQNTATEHTPSSTSPITDSHSKTVNEYTNWQLAEQLTYTVNKHLEVYAAGTYYRKGIYRPKGKYPKYDVKTFDLKYRNASASFGGKWTSRRKDVITLDVDWNQHMYYHAFTAKTLAEGFDENSRLILDFPYFAGQSVLQSNQERTMAHLKGIFHLPGHNVLSAGAEWRRDFLKAPTSIDGYTASDHTEALYFQDEWRLLSTEHTSLLLTGGLRFNHNEAFGNRLTPKLSAMFRIADLRLRASWSQGFKTPTLKELNYRYIREMSSVIMYLGNKHLDAQKSNYFSLGAEYTAGPLNITVTGYYNRLDDMIALVTIPRSEAPAIYRQQYGEQLNKVRRYENMEDARTYGVDVSLRLNLNELAFGANYSYLDTDAHVYNTDHNKLNAVTIDGMAHHKGNLFATWNHRFHRNYRLGLGLYGRASSKRYYQVDGDGKGYTTWRLSTTHNFGHSRHFTYRLEAGIDNIFNYVDRTPHGLHLGTTTPGTTVYATLTLRFSHGKNLITKPYSFNSKSQQDNESD